MATSSAPEVIKVLSRAALELSKVKITKVKTAQIQTNKT